MRRRRAAVREGVRRRRATSSSPGPAHAAPSLAALAELAIARYEREEFCAPDEVLPMYLRKSDAELAWDRKDR